MASAVGAQREQRQTLTPDQADKIRDAGIDPNLRIALYTKFLEGHADTLKKLSPHASSPSAARQIDNGLQDFSSLLDELGSNLDQYGDRKADLRPALKKLNETIPKWLALLQGLPGGLSFDESRKEAVEACQDLSSDAKQLEADQLAYFKAHKEDKGQERAEPE
jgi:hypothetical protein